MELGAGLALLSLFALAIDDGPIIKRKKRGRNKTLGDYLSNNTGKSETIVCIMYQGKMAFSGVLDQKGTLKNILYIISEINKVNILDFIVINEREHFVDLKMGKPYRVVCLYLKESV